MRGHAAAACDSGRGLRIDGAGESHRPGAACRSRFVLRISLVALSLVAAGMALAAAPTVAQAQGGCASCVSSTVCAWITNGTGSSSCRVVDGVCHEGWDICVVNESRLDAYLRDDLVLADGRRVRAVPLAPNAWFAQACSTGRAVFVLSRGDGWLDLVEDALDETY